ncbi:MAG: hypothetical protein WCK11_04720 [Candidatus Falkowbacteria bacterium]
MKNLKNVGNCEEVVRGELGAAHITVVVVEKPPTEVGCCLEGALNGWRFVREVDVWRVSHSCGKSVNLAMIKARSFKASQFIQANYGDKVSYTITKPAGLEAFAAFVA